MQDKPEKTPLERAMAFLARRGYSSAELLARLKKAGIAAPEAAAAVAECRRLNFINDELYARDCAAMLADRGCGSYKIRLELRRRGVGEFIEAVLDDDDGGEYERALAAARFKRRALGRLPADRRKTYEKVCRFLLSRGFPPGIVRRAAADSEKADED